jgi:transposase-like protein/DNA-directed RNA polymerase subunit RPC12/RpoP
MEFPTTQIGFEQMFSTEEACLAYFVNLKIKDGYKCSACGYEKYWLMSRRRVGCQKCKKKVSLTTGTIFAQSNKPLLLWFRVIWQMIAQKNGISAMGVQRIMGFGSYRTAWTWLHKLRMVTVLSSRAKLNGKVEVDETLLGGKSSGKRGRGAEGKILVGIAVEVLDKGTGRVRLSSLPDASRKSLKKFITNNIEDGSELITDGWKPYEGIEGFKHTVIHNGTTDQEENLLPHIHRIASLLKRWLLGTHQNYVTGNKVQNYLDEFTFKYNRRKSNSRGLLFQRVLQQVVSHNPITYAKVFDNANQ